MTVVHINRSAAVHHQPDDEREPVRWCFRCRAHREGTHELMREPVGSYYDHWWRYRCDGCGEDHRYFPGCDPA